MRISQKIGSLSLLQKIFAGVSIFLFIFAVFGFLVLPPVLKSILIKKLSEQLHRQVVIKSIKINPFALSMNVQGVEIKSRTGPETFLSFNELYVNLQSASIYKKGLILEEIRIDRPYLNIVRNEDKSYNFSDLVEGDKAKPSPESKPLKFSLNNIQILNGSVDFFDGPKHTGHKLRDVEVKIPFISNLPHYVDIFVQPAFSVKVNGNPVVLKGKSKPFANNLETVFDVDIKDLDIPYYLAYIPSNLNLQFLSGYFSANTTVSYSRYSDREPTIRLSGNISLTKIRIVDKDKDPLLNFPEFTMKDINVDLSRKELMIIEVSTQEGLVSVKRLRDHKLNFEKVFTPSTDQGQPAPKEKEAGKGEWVLKIKKLLVDKYALQAEDHVPSRPVKIVVDQIKLECENLSNMENSTSNASLSLTLNKRGTLSVDGVIGANPLLANLKFNVNGIDIVPFQPYFTDKIKIIVTGGRISTNGDFSFTYAKDKVPRMTYKGKALFSRFSSIDKANAEDFLKWNSLYLNGIDVSYDPLRVKIREVALSDFYSRIVINPDGTLNVQGIVEENGAEAGEPPSEKKREARTGPADKKADKPILTKIEKITLQGGTINFSDRHIQPNYSANMIEMGGRISGLSSGENTLADVDLKGKLDNYAPLDITGKINPLKEDLFVDLKVDFKDMDLSPVTPYSGKFVGYTIQKGKLSLNLQYLIVKKKLDSQNIIFLDQLTLGDKVDSPQATKLPVKLAIALLKNRKGEIKLDLPVSGQLDDPQFSVGRIILKILINILTKAATSPFALLGALFGGGEELGYLEFDYGSSAINEQGAKKLDTLVNALYDRPQLKMEIEGHVDVEKDKEGLRQYLFNKKVKSQKLKEMIKKGMPAVPVDEVKIEQNEYPNYLKKAYKEEKFPKPRNFIGMAKDLPVPEMEKLMLTHIEIKNDDLRLLASQRAQKVKDYLLRSNKIEQERIFLVEPKSLQPEKKEKLKDSRTDFKLK
jgi:hypothetical protein